MSNYNTNFINEFDEAIPLGRNIIDKVLEESLRSSEHFCYPRYSHDKIICIEELSELQKEITKDLRGDGNYYSILEEAADVQIVLYYIQRMFGVSDEELERAVAVKVTRLSDTLARNGRYD